MKNTKWEIESIGTPNRMKVSIVNGNEVTFECNDDGEHTSFTVDKEDLKSLIIYLIQVDHHINQEGRNKEEKFANHSRSQMEQELNEMRSHSELAGAANYR